ncbi:MAG: PfkB domain protein [Glaciihabitans sp.]|nr:PfkB domain protein [Glaciihabitans sp.]
MFSIAVAGHVCVDLTPALPAGTAIVPGQLVNIGALNIRPGGCVANTGGDLADLGINVATFGLVGDDDLGRILRDKLAARGIRTDGILAVPGEGTSYSIVFETPGTNRAFWHHVGVCSTFDGAQVDVSAADLLHVGYPSLLPALLELTAQPLVALLAAAKATGASTSLDLAVVDPASPVGRLDWAAIFRRILPLTDVFSPSIDDLVSALGLSPILDRAGAIALADSFLANKSVADETVADSLVASPWVASRGSESPGAESTGVVSPGAESPGAAIVMLSAGESGFLLRTADAGRFSAGGRVLAALDPEWHNLNLWVEAAPVPHLVTTNGAGDAATAGLLAALALGLGPGQATALVTAVASTKIQGGDVSAIPLPVPR